MEPEFIKEYASRMSVIFADRSLKAKNSRETDDYVKYLEERRDFWEKIAQLQSIATNGNSSRNI
jgi:hypothetical protein